MSPLFQQGDRDPPFIIVPTGIINIVDATNSSATYMPNDAADGAGHPMVLALNMMDEVRSNGSAPSTSTRWKRLGIPVVPISRRQERGRG